MLCVLTADCSCTLGKLEEALLLLARITLKRVSLVEIVLIGVIPGHQRIYTNFQLRKLSLPVFLPLLLGFLVFPVRFWNVQSLVQSLNNFS